MEKEKKNNFMESSTTLLEYKHISLIEYNLLTNIRAHLPWAHAQNYKKSKSYLYSQSN